MMCQIKTSWCCFLLGSVLFQLSCGNGNTGNYTDDIGVLNKQLVSASKHNIRTGDVILRSGRDFTSYRIRELSDKDKTYSHAGIALVSDTNVFIYHIIPPDLDEDKGDSTMRMEPLEQFAKPSKCFGFGIVRYKLTEPEIDKAMHYLDSLKDRKVSFDHVFDLTSPDQMYCSEMVDNALRRATDGRIQLGRKIFTKAQAKRVANYLHASIEEVMKHAYIPIDNINLNPDCTVIYNYVFLK